VAAGTDVTRDDPAVALPGGLRDRLGSPSVVLFLALFATQAALLVLTPILPALAADLDVSTSTAAQLRAVSGIVAGGVALWLGMRSRPRGLWDLLSVGLALLATGCVASALAPTFAVLVGAQVVVGAALGVVLSSALAAAGQWAPEDEARVLAWALAGQPVAWVVGMPLVGYVAETGWRMTWIVVPTAAAVLALVTLSARPRDAAPPPAADEPPLWRQPGIRGWAIGELLAYGGWAGTLVFVGALFVESYATSTTAVGWLLAAAAAAYVPGNFLARRWAPHHARQVLVGFGAVCAIGMVVLGAVRPDPRFSAVVLAGLAFLAGARTLAGSALGLRLAPACRVQAMGFRTAAVQFGYLLGGLLGGLALSLGGYRALGWTLGSLQLVAVLPHVRLGSTRPVVPRPASG
jgi:MFS transporter, DHA1 family, inner membrane transport protein